MFTGIVQALGIVMAESATVAGKRFTVSLAELSNAPIAMGDSVCVSGVCLTVTRIANGNVSFDVISETLRHSTLGQKGVAARVNLELAVRPDSYLGGHFVQGHVDAVGRVVGINAKAEDWRITIEVTPEQIAYIAPKGSVTVEGVSMTVAGVTKRTFTIAVIPTTLERTTLSALKVGEQVNVETDILARTVVHYLQQMTRMGKGVGGGGGGGSGGGGELTLEKLVKAGLA